MEFRVLGPLQVVEGGRSLPLAGTKQRALLALLLLDANRVVSSDRLIDGIWGEEPPESARNAVQVYVSQLRRLLALAEEGQASIVTSPPGYVLHVPPESIDLYRFTDLARRGRAALQDGDAGSASLLLHEGLALFTGEPLSDLETAAFAQGTIGRLHEERLQALEDRQEADLALGRHSGMVGELEALVHEHPFRERLRKHLMLALYRAGRTAEALQAYLDGMTALSDELGVDPGSELAALYQAILNQAPDLRVPQESGGGNLPVQPTRFLGRRHELDEVGELLRREDVRILTLTGPGGIGKTRLALEAAGTLEPFYPGGAWFVELASLTDPELVLPEVASVLGVHEAGDGSIIHALATWTSRRTLVVLDNLEQLLPDAAARVAEISRAVRSLDLVCCSREPLHVAAEREYPVDPLDDDEAVALFVERAKAARPGFSVGEDERETVRAVCVRVDRLPLAIELAAARTKVLPPTELLDRLEQRLPLLTGGARDAPARQRTLRGTIAWSYDLLPDGVRPLFESLAVFSGGWTLDAAEVVCGANLDTLQALIDRSFVREQPTPHGPRYYMLETIREFALEELGDREDAGSVRRRHAEYYLEIAVTANPKLKDRDQARWIQRLDAEQDNFRAAIRWALDGGDPELGLTLIVEVYYVWSQRPLSERRRWLAEGLERTPQVVTETRARALHQAGFLAGEQGDEREAVTLLEEAIDHARQLGATATEAFAMSNLSNILPEARASERLPLAEEAVRLARTSDDPWLLAITLNNLGESYRESRDAAATIAAYEESFVLLRSIGDELRVALVLGNLAETAILTGDLDRARKAAIEALHVSDALGQAQNAAAAQAALGWVALAEDNPREAADRFRASLRLRRDLGLDRWSVNVFLGLASAAASDGDLARAARLEAVAIGLEEALGHMPTAADAGFNRRFFDEARASADPTVWESAAREGAAMSLEEGIAYALSG